MNKIIQIITIVIFLAAIVILITIVGIWALVVASIVGIVIALLIERVRNEKKKDYAGDCVFIART